MSELCEKTGADVNEAWKAIGMDSRIGAKFQSFCRFGALVFQKDILNLVYIAKSYGLQRSGWLLGAGIMNDHQKRRFSIKNSTNLIQLQPIKRLLSWLAKRIPTIPENRSNLCCGRLD
jgi:UDPglucose 6-dehydrogenase